MWSLQWVDGTGPSDQNMVQRELSREAKENVPQTSHTVMKKARTYVYLDLTTKNLSKRRRTGKAQTFGFHVAY